MRRIGAVSRDTPDLHPFVLGGWLWCIATLPAPYLSWWEPYLSWWEPARPLERLPFTSGADIFVCGSPLFRNELFLVVASCPPVLAISNRCRPRRSTPQYEGASPWPWWQRPMRFWAISSSAVYSRSVSGPTLVRAMPRRAMPTCLGLLTMGSSSWRSGESVVRPPCPSQIWA